MMTSISRRDCLKTFASLGTLAVLPISVNASSLKSIETLIVTTDDECSQKFASELSRGLNIKEHWVSMADSESFLSLAYSEPSILMGLTDTGTHLLMDRLITGAGGSFIQTGAFSQDSNMQLEQLIDSHLGQLKQMQKSQPLHEKSHSGDFISFIAQI